MRSILILSAALLFSGLTQAQSWRDHDHDHDHDRYYHDHGYYGCQHERYYYHPQPRVVFREPVYYPRHYYYVPRPVYHVPVISLHVEKRTVVVPDKNTNRYPAPNSNTQNNSQDYVSAMASEDFEKAKNSIYSQSTDESRLSVAEEVAGSNYLVSEQVKEIMGLFSFESTRLEFAKFAYNNTLDKNNYYIVNDALELERSVKELNDYINGK